MPSTKVSGSIKIYQENHPHRTLKPSQLFLKLFLFYFPSFHETFHIFHLRLNNLILNQPISRECPLRKICLNQENLLYFYLLDNFLLLYHFGALFCSLGFIHRRKNKIARNKREFKTL